MSSLQLEDAIDNEDLESIETMMLMVHETHLKDELCMNAVVYAAQKSRWKIVKHLVTSVSEGSTKNQYYITAAIHAIDCKQWEEVHFLLHSVDDETLKDKWCSEMAKSAAIWCAWEVVKTLTMIISNQEMKDRCCVDFANAAAASQELDVRNFFVETISVSALKEQFCLNSVANIQQDDVASVPGALQDESTEVKNTEKEMESSLFEVVRFLSENASDTEVREQCCKMVAENEKRQTLPISMVENVLKGVNGITAAKFASMKGYTEVVKRILQKLSSENERRECCMVAAESAAKCDQFEVLKFLLQNCNDNRFKSACCMKVAEVAACCGHFEMAKYSIEAIKDQDMRNQCCLKAAESSALNREIQTIKFLLDSIADELKDQCCGTAIKPAAKIGKLKVVEYLVEKIVDESIKEQCCKRGAKSASDSNYWSVVKFLVQSVSTQTVRDECYVNAAESAAWSGYAVETKFFVDSIVDQRLKGQGYLRAVESAASNLKIELAESLIKMEVVKSLKDQGCLLAIKPAARDEYLEFVKFVVQTVSDKRMRDLCCITAVKPAALNGHTKVVKFLVQSAEDSSTKLDCCMKAAESSGSCGNRVIFDALSEEVNALSKTLKDERLMDQYQVRAAESAAECGNVEAMMSYLQSVQDEDLKSECNRLCAIAGASFGHENIIDCFEIPPQWIFTYAQFVEFLSIMSIRGENSILYKMLSKMSTAEILKLLSISIANEHVSLALTLMPNVKREQIDLPDSTGATALMLSADAGHHELIEKLLDLGASVCAEDTRNRTCLTRACEAGHVRAANSLIDRGAEASHRDSRGLTCGQLAERLEHFELLRLLEYFSLRNEDKSQDKQQSNELHQLLNLSGFTSERAESQQAMADLLQRIANVVVRDDRKITGSYAEGWANSLVQVNGRTAADSDIDWTVFVAGQNFHLVGGCSGTGNFCSRAAKLQVTKSHAQVPEGSGSQPAVRIPASGVRPRQDLCRAIRCCSDFFTEPSKERLTSNDGNLIDVHLVKATRPAKHTISELRVSFSFHEKRIMRNLSTTQGQLFTVIKFIFKRHLPITLKTPGLKTYHAKTLLFFMLQKHGTEHYSQAWQPENLIDLVKESLDMMLNFIDSSNSPDECMTHFFMSYAPLYFKNAGIGGDFNNTKSRVRLRLSDLRKDIREVIEQMRNHLRPLQVHDFYFHPFTLLPLSSVAKVNAVRQERQNQYMQLGDVYCMVHQCLHQQLILNETERYALMIQLNLLNQLHWCKCAVLCLTAMMHLKFGEAEEAKKTVMELLNYSPQPAWKPELFPKDRLRDWEVPLDSDWAWRFCFPCETPPRFPFLPEFTQTLFTARLSQPRASHLYVNFRCLSWSLQAELLNDRTKIAFEPWKTELQEDADLEELLTLAHYSDSREHLEFCLQQIKMLKKERRVAMETQDEEKICKVREKLERISTALS